MKVSIELEVAPFTVPNYVAVIPPTSKREPMEMLVSPKTTYPLHALNADTLDRLCQEFRASVFDKAGVADPNPSRLNEKTTA